MKRTPSQLQAAQERLKLKSNQLSLRVRMQEDRTKLAEISRQIKNNKGRV